MAQTPHTPSGLEIDIRQNEFPSAYVTDIQDRYPTAHLQDEYPTAYNVHPPYPAANQEGRLRGEDWDGQLEKPSGQVKAQESRICGVRRLTFWLCLAMGGLVVVVGVGGGVLGSRMGNGSESQRCVLTSGAKHAFGSTLTVRLGFYSAVNCRHHHHHQHSLPPHQLYPPRPPAPQYPP